MTNSQTVCNFVQRRKNNLIKVFGGKCCICGFDKWQSALEFHHVNPEEKEFGLTTDTTTKALEKQLLEAKKCILVCSNCHRGIHSGFVEIPTNWETFYNEEIANELLSQLDKKKHYYCIDCGTEISRSAIRCKACADKHQQHVERPTREQLKNMIRTQTFESIGRLYQVDGNSIRKWCDRMNLPRTRKEIKSYSDEEWAAL